MLKAAGIHEPQVVLPITDPYVLHHGALGSFVWVYLPSGDLERAREALARLDGVEEVYTREEAAVIYEHPADRIGDLSVASDARTALGKSRAAHDLSAVASGLRSHGGRHEQIVPIIVSHLLGMKGVVVGEGDTYDEAIRDVKSAIRFHMETFGDADDAKSPSAQGLDLAKYLHAGWHLAR